MLKNLEEKVDRMSKQMGYLNREIERINWKFIKLNLEIVELKNSMSEMKINHLGLKEYWTLHKKILVNLKTSQYKLS